MRSPFVVISGIPGSGKTTLGRTLETLLELPLIDKDAILERLFEARSIGDAGWRRRLSRESDDLLREQASHSSGAILVSFWHVDGMPSDSGTPTDWLLVPGRRLAHVHCVCEPETAAMRFRNRLRHQGHRDADVSPTGLIQSLRRDASRLPPRLGPRFDVDTAKDVDARVVAQAVRDLWRTSE